MPLSLGLENLKTSTENTEIPATTVEEIIDMIEACEQFESELDEIGVFNRVFSIGQAIANSKNPQAVIDAFDRDKTFHKAFNNGGDCLQNIANYLQASVETYWGDAARHNQAGEKTAAWTSKGAVQKVKEMCSRYNASNIDASVLEHRAVALPPAKLFDAQVKYLRMMGKAVSVWKKNPNITEAQAKQIYHKLGFEEAQANSDLTGEMSAKDILKALGFIIGLNVAGHVAVAAAGAAAKKVSKTGLGQVAAFVHMLPPIMAVMRQLGGMAGIALSQRRDPIGKRGWTTKNLGSACASIVALLNEAATATTEPLPKKDKSKYDIKSYRIMRELDIAYMKGVLILGRALITAIGVVK